MRYRGGFLATTPNNGAFPMEEGGLQNTSCTNGAIYHTDASQLFPLSGGKVSLRLQLPQPIVNGVYAPLDDSSSEYDLQDYLIWAVNIGGGYITSPGIYAALTPNGIEFTIWTAAGRKTLLNTTANISADTDFELSFSWNSEPAGQISEAMAQLAVDGENTTSIFTMDTRAGLSGYNFWMLDGPENLQLLQCNLKRIEIYNKSPIELLMSSSSSESSISGSSISQSSNTSSTFWRSSNSSSSTLASFTSTSQSSSTVELSSSSSSNSSSSSTFASLTSSSQSSSGIGVGGGAWFQLDDDNVIIPSVSGTLQVAFNGIWGHSTNPLNCEPTHNPYSCGAGFAANWMAQYGYAPVWYEGEANDGFWTLTHGVVGDTPSVTTLAQTPGDSLTWSSPKPNLTLINNNRAVKVLGAVVAGQKYHIGSSGSIYIARGRTFGGVNYVAGAAKSANGDAGTAGIYATAPSLRPNSLIGRIT